MSDEESMSEGFSASEDEWKPSKETRGGESSDDDDSDFEESSPIATVSASSVGKKRLVHFSTYIHIFMDFKGDSYLLDYIAEVSENRR